MRVAKGVDEDEAENLGLMWSPVGDTWQFACALLLRHASWTDTGARAPVGQFCPTPCECELRLPLQPEADGTVPGILTLIHRRDRFGREERLPYRVVFAPPRRDP